MRRTVGAAIHRVATSPWTGAVLVFSVFQWLWMQFLVSACAAGCFLLLVAVLIRMSRGCDTKPLGGDWLLLSAGVEAAWALVWTYHGIEHRPDQAGWALLAGAIFLLYAVDRAFDWRAEMAKEAAAAEHSMQRTGERA